MKKLSFIFPLLFCTFSACKKEEVIPPVIADFIYKESTNGKVEFTNLSKNSMSYEWDFNTGDNSNSQNPIYIFAKNKDYWVTLTAKGAGGQNSISKTIRITTKPTTGNYAIYTNWAKAGFVDIYVSGVYEGRLTKYFSSGSPDCFDNGSVTVTKPAGSYTYTAKSTAGYNWSGTLVVENGICKKTKLTE